MEKEPKCTTCPECDSRVYVNKNLVADGYRECAHCGQEWWTDIDYDCHINKKKAKEANNG